MLPLDYISLSETTCENQPYPFGDSLLTETGSYSQIFSNINGCDSTVDLYLFVYPLDSTVIYDSVCIGYTYMFEGNYYPIGDTVLYSINSSGCNRTVYLHIAEKYISTTTIDTTICSGNYIDIGGGFYNADGTYQVILQNVNGCDSTVQLNLTVLPLNATTVNQSICAGDSFFFQNIWHKQAGTFPYHFNDMRGCDSTVTLSLSIHPIKTSNLNTSICFGDSVLFGNTYYKTSGQYQAHFTSVENCDSVVTLQLTLRPQIQQFITNAVCTGDSILFNNMFVKDSGQYTAHFVSVEGCDSTVTLDLEVYPQVSLTTLYQSICIGGSYTFNGNVITQEGTYNALLKTIHQCDSAVVLYLEVDTPILLHRKIDSCFQANINGTVYLHDTVTSTHIVSLISGCDSIIYLDSVHIFTPTITIQSSEDIPLIVGEQSTLNILPSGNYSNIQWSPNQTISNSHSASPIISPVTTTQYIVTLTDTNHCQLSDSILVSVSQALFAMPTAFSPNGDGNNDLYFPVLSSNAVGVEEFRIYNQWGELVFDMNESTLNGWDGNYKGDAQPVEVYTYFLKVSYKNQKHISKVGSFTLLR